MPMGSACQIPVPVRAGAYLKTSDVASGPSLASDVFIFSSTRLNSATSAGASPFCRRPAASMFFSA